MVVPQKNKTSDIAIPGQVTGFGGAHQGKSRPGGAKHPPRGGSEVVRPVEDEIEYLDLDQAAKLIHTCQATLQRKLPVWRAKGLRTYKPCKSQLVIKSEFLAFIKAKCICD